jgi:predicted Zn finger-like uncharacterized protein
MFTRCPACRTVFHITAAELRSADGTVICGACDATFDALDSLSEIRPVDAEFDEPPPNVEPHEDSRELDEDAHDTDEFLEEIESLIGDEDQQEKLPAGPADRFETGPEPRTPESDPLYDEIPDEDSVFRIDDTPEEPEWPSTAPFVDAVEAPDSADPMSLKPETAIAADTDRITEPVDPGLADDAAEHDDGDGVPGFVRERRPGTLWLRILLPLAAALLLMGTWIHAQRAQLLRVPAGQAVLGPVYAALGMQVAPDWRPAEFRVVRSEAIANADEPDILHVAVEFLNGAGFAQPYPVIRIALHDRFGRRVGTHDFAPAQYLDANTHDARLAAGDRLRASVAVPDPGARADGFRVDLCLELDARGLVCAAEPFR